MTNYNWEGYSYDRHPDERRDRGVYLGPFRSAEEVEADRRVAKAEAEAEAARRQAEAPWWEAMEQYAEGGPHYTVDGQDYEVCPAAYQRWDVLSGETIVGTVQSWNPPTQEQVEACVRG